jgi:hypothetical protein
MYAGLCEHPVQRMNALSCQATHLVFLDYVRRHFLVAHVALLFRVELEIVLFDSALGDGLVTGGAQDDVPRAVQRVHAVVDHGNVALAVNLYYYMIASIIAYLTLITQKEARRIGSCFAREGMSVMQHQVSSRIPSFQIVSHQF